MRNPNATLSQLRGHPKRGEKPLSALKPRPIWETPWAQLTPKEKSLRNRSRSIYGQLYRNPMLSLSYLCKYSEEEITPKEVLSNLGNAFVKKKGRWVARPNFRNEVTMLVFTDGDARYLPIRDFASARTIGKYFNQIGTCLEKQAPFEDWNLNSFPLIMDSAGRSIQLEADARTVLFLSEISRGDDGFDIYGEEVGL